MPKAIVAIAPDRERRNDQKGQFAGLKLVDDLFGRSNQRESAPACDEVKLKFLKYVLWKRKRLHSENSNEVLNRLPITLFFDVVVKIIRRLFLSRSTNHVGAVPYLNRTFE
jgi:hypothetical protein